MLTLQVELETADTMKSIIRFVLFSTLSLCVLTAQAQSLGKESRVLAKNINIGIKGGVNALDMAYSNENNAFVNPSILYSKPLQMTSCLMGGIYVERTLPRFAYGVEFLVNGLNAVNVDTVKPHYATQDSAFFAQVRIPVKVRFFSDKNVVPYIFVAPSVGTYLSAEFLGTVYDGYSIWNGESISWGTNNTRSLQMNVVAGAGVDFKIPVSLYEINLRVEACYTLGLLDLTSPNLSFNRKTRGWEATIGVNFPLFTNPSYVWFN